MCFACGWKFQFLAILRVRRVKNCMSIPFPRSFWLVDMWKYGTKHELLHIKNWKISENKITKHSCIKSKTKGKLATLQEACEIKVSEFKVSELGTSFSISSLGSLVFTTVLMTMRVFFVFNTIENARDPATLSYQLTANS